MKRYILLQAFRYIKVHIYILVCNMLCQELLCLKCATAWEIALFSKTRIHFCVCTFTITNLSLTNTKNLSLTKLFRLGLFMALLHRIPFANILECADVAQRHFSLPCHHVKSRQAELCFLAKEIHIKVHQDNILSHCVLNIYG